ncbi:Ion channel [Dictyocaulus viviparus]|uniref:Ion channel n=1 Tax=Dictyocaulus viviparus TaxID=29172 RepID=A0A0D8Y584_DICVI|nr:Ion channel [Dictyocaulus viviparus]
MTVIYSCVGIPLMLITLNDCGKFLYNNINGLVKNVENFATYLGVLSVRGRADLKFDEMDSIERGEGNGGVEVSSVKSDFHSLPSLSEIDDIDRKETPRMSVKVALGITIGWIFFCSALFRSWENWTYAESCYFMYISLSTIGLGDISVARRDMMVLCFVFVIIGLSLVSMSINVVQKVNTFQVSLEDFYVNLMMKLIIEYQEKMAAGDFCLLIFVVYYFPIVQGDDHMGASVGMMRMWSGNKTAKYLMPLLSKEKKRVAMDKVEREAQSKGFEVPKILTELDEKTGMPVLFHLEKKIESEEPIVELEQMVQRQIIHEEANEIPILIVHEAECQTDTVETSDESEQTVFTICQDRFCQTDEVKTDCVDVEVQTETEDRHDAGAQTIVVELVDAEVVTTISSSEETQCQTETIPTMDQISQTIQADYVDAEVATEIETKNIRIQTPCPIISQRSIQTDDLDERKSPSKMSSAKKRLRRAFAKSRPSKVAIDDTPTMSEWKDVKDEEVEEGKDDASDESLHWDPVDGLHAEKQLPVSFLTEMFDRKQPPQLEKRLTKRKSLSPHNFERSSSSRKSN